MPGWTLVLYLRKKSQYEKGNRKYPRNRDVCRPVRPCVGMGTDRRGSNRADAKRGCQRGNRRSGISTWKRLYEDNVLGRVTNEQFRMLSSDYNAEQKALEDAIPEKESRLETLKASAANVDGFIEKAKRYTTIDELTPERLRLFIQRIEIGERAKEHSYSSGQSIRIIYRDIGLVDSSIQGEDQKTHIAAEITSKEQIIKLLA